MSDSSRNVRGARALAMAALLSSTVTVGIAAAQDTSSASSAPGSPNEPAPATPLAPEIPSALTSQNAVEIAVQNNPNLQIALLQETQAKYAVLGEEALYVAIFDANAGYTHSRNPSLRDTGTTVSTTDSIDLGAALTQPFATGTVVRLSISNQRSVRTSPPVNAVGTEGFVSAPAYAVVGQLSLTQPLLRGAGTTLGLASLRVARLNRTAALLATQQASSQLLHDVLLAYWELWYAAQVVRIDEASRDLAKNLEGQARDKAKSGILARIDALPFSTQLAELEESVVVAATTRRQRSLTLAQALGRADRSGPELESSDTPPNVAIEDVEQRAIDEALAASYQLKSLDAQLQIAQYQAKIAGDGQRPRLDLDAYVQAQGLGNGDLPAAFGQAGRGEAVSAHVGLTFQTPLTNTRRNAQIQNALLSAHIAQKSIEAARQQLRSDVTSALAQRAAAASRVSLAEQTEKVAGEQAEGEKARFLAGTSIAIQVQQADDSHRQAQLRVQRARVDLVEADLDLLHLRGRLLERYTDVLKRFAPSAVSLDDAREPM
jgi:outer membrane protein